MKKINIIEAGNELGLGGTEYVIQLFSKFLNKEYFELTVVGIYNGGERAELMADLGIPVVVLKGDMDKLRQMLDHTDVFHWHGSGLIDERLFSVLKAHKPKLIIQTNVFGLYDHARWYDLMDYDLYVSEMILIRRMYLDRLIPNATCWAKRKVLSNPVDVDQLTQYVPTAAEIREFKRSHHLEDHFIVGRIGRSDNHKFDLITLDAFAEFALENERALFLLVGATQEMLAHAAALGIAEKVIVFDTSTALKTLLCYYSLIDVFLAASRIGESFGMVIAEAMTLDIPVITVSTEDRDNAQIEIVDNGSTGLVLERNAGKMAAAISYLYTHPEKRKEFGISAKEKVSRNYKADQIVRSLEMLIFAHLHFPIPPDYANAKEESLIKAYSSTSVLDYIRRCQDVWENK